MEGQPSPSSVTARDAVLNDAFTALLGLLVSHRSAAVLRNAEPALCAISILGGCVADLSVVWMLGEVSTARLHATNK